MYNQKNRQYSCMNNVNENYEKEKLEQACQNEYCKCEEYDEDCGCGFNDEEENEFPENPVLGQSYVPMQFMDKTFKPKVGLKMGTIYPELVSPYCPGQSMKEIAYLESANTIGEGCNACRKKIEKWKQKIKHVVKKKK